MELRNKKVIVTGGAAGMGKEMVKQLLGKGAYVSALDINKEGLDKLKLELNNDKLSVFEVNMANNDSLLKFKEDYYKVHSEVDCLINNAGIIQPFVHVEELDDKTVDRVMDVNFFGPVNLIRMFLNDLKKRPIANITNISSMGGFFPFPGQTIYGASKAALKLFTEGLYAESLNSNVKVMVVFPGAIATDITKNSNVETKASAENTKVKMLSPNEAARQIISGIEKNKFKLYVGNDAKFMHFMYNISAKRAIKFINKMMAKSGM